MSHEIKVNGYEPSKWPSRPKMNVDAHEKPAVLQPDWDQNDATAADYVKNRTHYSEVGEGVIGVGYEGWATVTGTEEVPIPKVQISGVIYENVQVRSTAGPMVYYEVGNYTISVDREHESISIAQDGIISEVDIKFLGLVETVHKLPVKYIPTEYFPQSDWNEENMSSTSYIKNKPNMQVRDVGTPTFTASNYIKINAYLLNNYNEVYIIISTGIDNLQEGKSIVITGQDQDIQYTIGYAEDLDPLKKPLIILHLYRKIDPNDYDEYQRWFGFAVITNNHLIKSMSVIYNVEITKTTSASNPFSGYLNIYIGTTVMSFKAGSYSVYGKG